MLLKGIIAAYLHTGRQVREKRIRKFLFVEVRILNSFVV